MSQFAIFGTEKFDQKINEDLTLVQQALWDLPEAKLWDALVLMGGYGRGEGTVLRKGGDELPYNDYDLILVTKNHLNFFYKRKLRQKLGKLEEDLSQKLNFPVDVFLHTPETLIDAENSLMNYELKNGHRVLCGTQNILDLMPSYTLDELPLAEGTRLLLNRGSLLLMNRQRVEEPKQFSKTDKEQFNRYLMKCTLAMGDALLLAKGQYHISSKQKKSYIRSLSPVNDLPHFSWIVEKYLEALEVKDVLDYELISQDCDFSLFEKIVEVYQEFFLWFESQRFGCQLVSLEDYRNILFSNGKSLAFKDLSKSFLFFGLNSTRSSIKWHLVDAKLRLSYVLQTLLQKNVTVRELEVCALMLNVSELDKKQLFEKYFKLWGALC